MRTGSTISRLMSISLGAGLMSSMAVGSAFAQQDCPKERRKVCVQETLGGHTFKHPALTNECLAAKFGGKIISEGDCPH